MWPARVATKVRSVGCFIERVTADHANADAREEKTSRSALRAATEKAVNAKTIVVLDALNYIKGVRYELFCKAKAENTTYCVVRCVAVAASQGPEP